jgi:hypothetical protein
VGGTVVQPGSPIQIKVSNGYQEVELQIPLPDSGITVDLQIFVNGKLSPKNLTGILPNVVKTQKVTFAEKADSYIVTVKIAKTGTNNAEFLDYAQYNINGKTGMIVEEYRKANVLSVYDTTTTTGIVDTSDENVFYDDTVA